MQTENIKSFYQQSKVVEHYASATINIGLWHAEEKIFTHVFCKNDTILDFSNKRIGKLSSRTFKETS